MKLVSCLAHEAVVRLEDGDHIRDIVIPASNRTRDLDFNRFERVAWMVDHGIPVCQTTYIHSNAIMPPPRPETLYLVPKMIADLYQCTRGDLVYPAASPKADGAYRADGKIQFVRKLRLPHRLTREER